jgi:hypothetical protein
MLPPKENLLQCQESRQEVSETQYERPFPVSSFSAVFMGFIAVRFFPLLVPCSSVTPALQQVAGITLWGR